MTWNRHPRTAQEKRANGRRYTRGKRALCNLPDDWDDLLKSDAKDRSWKRSTKRRKQWKAK